MKAVIQTVKRASCTVEGKLISWMDEGLLVYFSVEKKDEIALVEPFIDKIIRLRIYRDISDKKMTDSICARSNSIMLISQFTLSGDLTRGNRPSFDNAKNGVEAEVFYNKALEELRRKGINTMQGVFGAHMMIEYINDGPETFILEM